MTELDRALEALAAEIDWPATPELAVRTSPRVQHRHRLGLMVVVAAILAALAVGLAEPAARSAILRFFHLGGVTIERVDALPPAQERALGTTLGHATTAARAEDALGKPVQLPAMTKQPRLYLDGEVVSVLLATPAPVLLSQFRSGDDSFLLKKFVGGSTGVESIQIKPGVPGAWIAGQEHVLLSPAAPPRLAGNVLLWVSGGITYRLEGRALDEQVALRLAREIDR